MRAVWPIRSGLEVVPNASLTIQRTAGIMTVPNENRANSALDVHNITFTAQNPTTFITTKQDGVVATGITSIPVDQYDNWGTLTNLWTNKWSTHRIYQFSSWNITFQYGQYSYNSLDLAKDGINDAYNEFLDSWILLAYLMIKEGTTDLTDANSFIQNTNKFGGIGWGVSGWSLTWALLIANNLSDLWNVTTAKTNLALENVDNTSDTTKDAATATLTNKTLTSPVINTPTGIVKSDVGLGNVDNTSDANKPVSTLQQAEIDTKLDTTWTAADSTKVWGITITGTPTVWQVATATSGTAATWQDAGWGGWWISEKFSAYQPSWTWFTTSDQVMIWGATTIDDWSNFNTTTWIYTIPSTWTYRFDVHVVVASSTNNDFMIMKLLLNWVDNREMQKLTKARDVYVVSTLAAYTSWDEIKVSIRNVTSSRWSSLSNAENSTFFWYKVD